MYQFTVWPRNDVQMFKLRHESGTQWICRHPPYRPSTSLIFLTATQTNVSVTDAVETWDYVTSTVVIVWVCSECVRVTAGVWKVVIVWVCSECVSVTAGVWKVVIVWVCSDCVRVTAGAWKVPGENHAPLPIFCVITLSYCSMVFVFELFASSVLPQCVFVFCHIVTACRVL